MENSKEMKCVKLKKSKSKVRFLVVVTYALSMSSRTFHMFIILNYTFETPYHKTFRSNYRKKNIKTSPDVFKLIWYPRGAQTSPDGSHVCLFHHSTVPDSSSTSSSSTFHVQCSRTGARWCGWTKVDESDLTRFVKIISLLRREVNVLKREEQIYQLESNMAFITVLKFKNIHKFIFVLKKSFFFCFARNTYICLLLCSTSNTL